ncbi:MAG: APC family permease, partial [Ruminiclostridium sp.]|nr:APC family permease [Ruminiclostridium sp.]
MSSVHEDKKQGVALQKYISPASAWAISFGCIIGWGAFVMPGTTFLPLAGPLGTAIGMFVGAVAMLVIGFNYHFMMKRYPDAGGSFTFAKEVFGEDHGFLSAWFMTLAYVAILWANISALPLVGRNIFG